MSRNARCNTIDIYCRIHDFQMQRAASRPYGKYAWNGALIFEVSSLVFNRRQWCNTELSYRQIARFISHLSVVVLRIVLTMGWPPSEDAASGCLTNWNQSISIVWTTETLWTISMHPSFYFDHIPRRWCMAFISIACMVAPHLCVKYKVSRDILFFFNFHGSHTWRL